jgi:hypothetical protein
MFFLNIILYWIHEAHTLSQGTLKDNRNTPSSSSRIRDDPEAVRARNKVYVKCATENKWPEKQKSPRKYMRFM